MSVPDHEPIGWLIQHLSTPDSRAVLVHLADNEHESFDGFDVAREIGVSLARVLITFKRAQRLRWVSVDDLRPGHNHRYRITARGTLYLMGTGWEPGTVIHSDDAAIDHDDQPASTTMTGPGGKPRWCTPGRGVCTACKENR